MAIFTERFLHFHRCSIHVGEFLQGLSNLVQKKKFGEALHEAAGTPGPVARVIHAALRRHYAPRTELKDIVQEAGQLEVPKLERYLSVLLTIAYVAPLIGLLGTVIGLIQTFVHVTGGNGFASPALLSKGIYEALITSAVGLAVAVPTYILYSYLAAHVKTLMYDMERAGIEVVNLLVDSRDDRDIISIAEATDGKSARRSSRDSLS
ncbi:MAG: MotA/TolQ/ExbB proton channel family protein [Verrucomicrobia bacterium]|nr:MotA/TolQ/ExbB proton channel family protein [Verrucomicrobiota bacterium]